MNGADIYMIALILVCAVGLIGQTLLTEGTEKKDEVKHEEQ